jgi:hypothetical protein
MSTTMGQVTGKRSIRSTMSLTLAQLRGSFDVFDCGNDHLLHRMIYPEIDRHRRILHPNVTMPCRNDRKIVILVGDPSLHRNAE